MLDFITSDYSYRHVVTLTDDMDAFLVSVVLQWNLCIVVTLGPTIYGCIIIEGGCIIEVHDTLAVCTLGPNKVALLGRLAAIE